MRAQNRSVDGNQPAQQSANNGHGRLLLVEDDPATARVMSRLMQSVGVVVETTGTVKEAIAALTRMPEVVILDLMLPDGSGIEILETIRSAKMRCKVAVVSASNDEKVLARLRAATPDAIFSKPLDFEDFVQWLCEAFPESPRHEQAA